MSKRSMVLRGLDASNPLAFMAALGVLQVSVDSGDRAWRLSWDNQGRWLPVLHGLDEEAELIEALQSSTEWWSNEPALQLAYDADGTLLSSEAQKATFDLKPLPSAFRSFLELVVATNALGNTKSVRQVAAYGSEIATNNNGRLKPTALHFTAGQQSFLSMVRTIRERLTREDFHEAVFGPWRNESRLPSLSWNASAPRVYAYRASDPSSEKRGSVPAADWLAFVGLRFFPTASRGSRLLTTCVRGGWKDSTMRWPIWRAPISINVVRSLLSWPGLWHSSNESALEAAGIVVRFESTILRSDQGGYGSFSPARVI